ncbi:hypothetical protein RHMOL_Rhmol10G0131000 [Rhododendron molle]|uniref:Uncharacterized protein n=1 Tax=Rhododendron molle TaxID=49168 RepID=A0ACC0M3A1_RHOML|nr:hypothetical protein RHMOL_Rhmol10G0131000 [Rhododendron molle]
MRLFVRVLRYYIEHFYISHTLVFLFGLPDSRWLRVSPLPVNMLRCTQALAMGDVDGRACCR